jgi:hypothetical protein
MGLTYIFFPLLADDLSEGAKVPVRVGNEWIRLIITANVIKILVMNVVIVIIEVALDCDAGDGEL